MKSHLHYCHFPVSSSLISLICFFFFKVTDGHYLTGGFSELHGKSWLTWTSYKDPFVFRNGLVTHFYYPWDLWGGRSAWDTSCKVSSFFQKRCVWVNSYRGGNAWVHCRQPAATNLQTCGLSQNAENGRATRCNGVSRGWCCISPLNYQP